MAISLLKNKWWRRSDFSSHRSRDWAKISPTKLCFMTRIKAWNVNSVYTGRCDIKSQYSQLYCSAIYRTSEKKTFNHISCFAYVNVWLYCIGIIIERYLRSQVAKQKVCADSSIVVLIIISFPPVWKIPVSLVLHSGWVQNRNTLLGRKPQTHGLIPHELQS